MPGRALSRRDPEEHSGGRRCCRHGRAGIHSRSSRALDAGRSTIRAIRTIGDIVVFIEGKQASVLDFMGFAQKGGAVLSFVRVAPTADQLNQVRIDTQQEAAYFQHGGILPYVLRGLVAT